MTLLTVRHASLGYHSNQPVLRDVSFQVSPGSVCCLLGANGSGKTTLMRTILGVLSPLHGDILLDGIAINHLNDRQRAATIAWVPQAHDGAFAFSALDMVMMGLAPQLAAFAVPALHPFSWTLKLESPMSRRKYTFQQRLEVVMHYFATDEGYRLTSARFNVPRTQVRIWVAAYDAYGEEGLKPRDKGVSIDPDIRVEAVKAVLTGQISQTQAAAKFNVAGSASVGKWMKVFSEHGEEGLRSLRVGKKRALHMIDDPVALEVALERSKDKRIQELEQKVRRLELRILYLKKLKALVR